MGFGKVKAAIVGARDVGKGVKWLEMTPAPYTPPPPPPGPSGAGLGRAASSSLARPSPSLAKTDSRELARIKITQKWEKFHQEVLFRG